METKQPPQGIWTLAAVVIAAQIAGIIIAFSIVDPCGCRQELQELRARLDSNAAELRALYEERAEHAR